MVRVPVRQVQPLEPAGKQAAEHHHDVAGPERQRAVSAVWEPQEVELARARRGAAAELRETVPEVRRDVRQAPAVQPADAQVRLSALAEAQLWKVRAARPSVARGERPSAQPAAAAPSEEPLAAACARAPFAVRPAPSSGRLARRGQIEKRKMRRSRARPVSDSSCPSLNVDVALLNKLHDAFAGDVSGSQWTDNGEAGVWRRTSPLQLFCGIWCLAFLDMNSR